MYKLAVLALLVGSTLGDLDECFKKDSISCVQMEVFRTAKSFFDQDSIELWGGFNLVKREGLSEKAGRSLDIQEENEVAGASDVEKREEALENFAVKRAARFLEERSITWNLSPLVGDVAQAARSISESIPQELKDQVSSFMEEGRGKKKKILKALLPLLLGLKLKLGGFLVLAYFVIALIAKKALLASLVALAISGFIAIKKLLSQHHHPHHEVHEVSHGWAGPSYGGGGGGYSNGGWDSYGGHDIHGSYSNNVAHSLAYSAQKPSTR